jgi:hypothetical protein
MYKPCSRGHVAEQGGHEDVVQDIGLLYLPKDFFPPSDSTKDIWLYLILTIFDALLFGRSFAAFARRLRRLSDFATPDREREKKIERKRETERERKRERENESERKGER